MSSAQTTTSSQTVASADCWITWVRECICAIWGEQSFQVAGVDRAAGIKCLIELRSDFDDLVRATARVIADVAPRLAKSGELADSEYDALLKEPLHRRLKFLAWPALKSLAGMLVAGHALKLEVVEARGS